MIFYDNSTAPSPRRVRILIAEKGLDIETKHVDLNKGEHLSSDFLALNPSGTVPVLITETGVAITENVAIAAYLDDMYPDMPLMGNTADDKALILMWNNIIEQQFGQPIADMLRNSHPKMIGRALPGPHKFEQIPDLAARSRKRIELFFERLEVQLASSDYIATSYFSFADISTFVFVQFAAMVKLNVPEENVATLAWYKKVSERDSTKI